MYIGVSGYIYSSMLRIPVPCTHILTLPLKQRKRFRAVAGCYDRILARIPYELVKEPWGSNSSSAPPTVLTHSLRRFKQKQFGISIARCTATKGKKQTYPHIYIYIYTYRAHGQTVLSTEELLIETESSRDGSRDP